MVTIEELKLGNKTLEALKFLLLQINELDVILNELNFEELREANNQAKTQIEVLNNIKTLVLNTENNTINQANAALTDIRGIVADFKGKQTEFNALKDSLEALKGSLKKLEATGVINDTDSSLIQTYSSKKIDGLIEGAKTTLANGIKSNTESLNNLASNVSRALEQKADKTIFNTFVVKITDGLNLKANKNDIPSVTSLEATFLKKTDKIDAYTKKESDKKFALKDDLPSLATEAKLGIVKLKNSITAKQEDAAVTEKAVAEAIEANKGLGIGQAWQNMTTQRKKDIVYTNTTNRAIMINVAGAINNSSEDMQLLIDNVLTQKINIGSRSGYVCAVVPAGATYKVTTSSNSQISPSNFVWMELR